MARPRPAFVPQFSGESTRRMGKFLKSLAPDRVAVENFLASLDGLTAHDAYENARMDARSYGWNAATLEAVINGIGKHFSAVSS